MTSGVLARWSAGRRRASARVAAVLALLILATILILGDPLRTAVAPLGIVSLQFVTSPLAAEAVLASWETIPQARLLWAHGLDLVLPVAYASAIVLAAAGSARRARVRVMSVRTAAVAAISAAVADQIENLAMFATILVRPTWASVLVTLVAAIAKFALLMLALGSLGSVLLAPRTDRLRSIAP
jgi:hypothetical protein